MAFQILPGESRAADIGSSLATGLGGLLGQLAQQKAQQLRTMQDMQRFQRAGLNPQDAQLISYFSGAPQVQAKLLSSLFERGGNDSPATLDFQSAMEEMPNATQQPQQQQPSPQGALSALQGLKPGMLGGGLQSLFPQAQGPQQGAPFQAAPQQAQQQPEQSSFYKPTKRELREQEKLSLKRKEISQKERAEAFKATKQERKEILEKARSARQNLQDLNRFEELEREGKLDTPGYVEFLKRSGLDIPALMNPGSEEFQKIAQSFLRDAKTYLGARISNFELEQFLKTIPNLSQSPEGRKRVIANLKYLNRAALEYSDALKEIMKENNNIPPLDLLEQIDDRIESKLDKLADRFKEDVAKPVPEGQNKYITALQAVAGEALSGIPGAVKGALRGAGKGAITGAVSGRYFGGPGALTGATLGGLGGLLGLL